MTLTIALARLASRTVRTSVTSTGVRRFASSAIKSETDDDGNIISKTVNGFSRFGGSLLSKITSSLFSGFTWTFSAIWGMCVSTFQFLWNFNWNVSDADLDAEIQSSITALGGTLGGTLGNALGYLTCGAIPGALIFTFNEPMGLHVLENVGEEALDEVAGNVANLIKQTFNLFTKYAFNYGYKNVRKLFREPDSKFRQRLISEGHMTKENIDKAVEERNKPWSFSIAFNNYVDSIPNEFLKNFVEEFVEEFSDACIEAGYVVAGGIDSFLAEQRAAHEMNLGSEQTVQLELIRESGQPATSP